MKKSVFAPALKQYRKIVLAYSRGAGCSVDEAVELILPGILKALESELKKVKFKRYK